MILIVSEPADIHSSVVAQRLVDKGSDVCIFSAGDFPQRLSVSWKTGGVSTGYTFKYADRTIDSDEVRGIWVRRLKSFAIAPSIIDSQVQTFTYAECKDFFFGWLSTFRNVINSCHNELLASKKLTQLHHAQELGFRIPETLISNDPEDIRAFYTKRKTEIIFKPLTGTAFQFTGAHQFEEAHLLNIEAGALAPSIYQERISVKHNLRITIVDQDVFAASIKVSNTHAELDWRLERNPVIEPYALPAGIQDKLLKLQQRLGLRYGAVDMIVNDDDEYVFLEDNPGGQFLFVEIPTKLPISKAVASALLNGA